jgi:hypothetical protein
MIDYKVGDEVICVNNVLAERHFKKNETYVVAAIGPGHSSGTGIFTGIVGVLHGECGWDPPRFRKKLAVSKFVEKVVKEPPLPARKVRVKEDV